MNVEEAAKNLARANAEAEPSIVRIFWFPHEQQVRLIEVDDQMPADDEAVHPYYFSPVTDIPYVSAVALVSVDQENKAPLPEDWGGWDNGQVLFERERKIA